MDNFNTHNHISGKFDTELESIHTKLTEMGKVVEKQLSLAIEAFATGNIEMAELVLQQDYVADEFEAVIDAQCVSTIALRQPTGRDLSLLIAIIKVTGDLDSIAAKAQGIADTTIHLKRMLPSDAVQEVDNDGQ